MSPGSARPRGLSPPCPRASPACIPSHAAPPIGARKAREHRQSTIHAFLSRARRFAPRQCGANMALEQPLMSAGAQGVPWDGLLFQTWDDGLLQGLGNEHGMLSLLFPDGDGYLPTVPAGAHLLAPVGLEVRGPSRA